jgi:nitroimidazol reductase NimA-like FMN-containing flavoprotein (pyridoxamine 5'-phosphate oxidase superfamily)
MSTTVSSEIEERIGGATLSAFLATSVDDRPHVAPVWYLYEDDHLYFFTQGRKLANVERNERVALAIEGPESHWLVVLRGTASVRTDETLREEVAGNLFAQYLDDVEADAYRTTENDPQGALVEVAIGSATLRDDE